MITRRQACQVIAATVAASLVPFDVMAETEESLRAEGLAAEKACRASDYADTPERWKVWFRRWRSHCELVADVAGREHPGWQAWRVGNVSVDGSLKFAYLTGYGATHVVGGFSCRP